MWFSRVLLIIPLTLFSFTASSSNPSPQFKHANNASSKQRSALPIPPEIRDKKTDLLPRQPIPLSIFNRPRARQGSELEASQPATAHFVPKAVLARNFSLLSSRSVPTNSSTPKSTKRKSSEANNDAAASKSVENNDAAASKYVLKKRKAKAVEPDSRNTSTFSIMPLPNSKTPTDFGSLVQPESPLYPRLTTVSVMATIMNLSNGKMPSNMPSAFKATSVDTTTFIQNRPSEYMMKLCTGCGDPGCINSITARSQAPNSVSKSAKSSKTLSNQSPEDLDHESSLLVKSSIEMVDFWPDETLFSINEYLKTVMDMKIRLACVKALAERNFPEFKRLILQYPALISMPMRISKSEKNLSFMHLSSTFSEISEFVFERISPLLIDYPDGMGNTPLYYAVLNENVKSLKALIGAGANADHVSNNKPLLQLAIEKSLFKSAEILLQHVNINSPIYQNCNVIFHLLVIQNFSLLQVVLDSSELIGLEIFYNAFKKLIASKSFTSEIATEVIKMFHSSSRYRIVLNNLLNIAFNYGRVDMLKTLHELGNDLDKEFTLSSTGDALRSVHVAVLINSQPIFDYLLSKNISPTTLDSLGRSVLDIALSKGHFGFAQHILDCNVLLSLSTPLETILPQVPKTLLINLIAIFPGISFITFPDGSNIITKCMKLNRSDLLDYILYARIQDANICDANGESVFSYSFAIDVPTKAVVDDFVETEYMLNDLADFF